MDCFMDIVLVQDDSSSIPHSLFGNTKQYMVDFTQCINSFDDRVGAILYNCEARKEIGLDEYTIGDLGLEADLDYLMQQGGITRTGPAIRYMRDTTALTWRNGARRVAVVLTDGYIQGYPLDDHEAEANAARDDGITLYSVGIGPNVNSAVLLDIAKIPPNVFDDTDPCALYDRILQDQCPGNGGGNGNGNNGAGNGNGNNGAGNGNGNNGAGNGNNGAGNGNGNNGAGNGNGNNGAGNGNGNNGAGNG
ncbi:collagen alpha-1(XXI) chain-like isoform X1 [Branchiostoma floridae x Branchiostoma japonicum]